MSYDKEQCDIVHMITISHIHVMWHIHTISRIHIIWQSIVWLKEIIMQIHLLSLKKIVLQSFKIINIYTVYLNIFSWILSCPFVQCILAVYDNIIVLLSLTILNVMFLYTCYKYYTLLYWVTRICSSSYPW